jgi:hypothetical protein
MWAKFEGLAEATRGRDEFGRECGISYNNFASEDAARFVYLPVGVSLKCRDEVSVQL